MCTSHLSNENKRDLQQPLAITFRNKKKKLDLDIKWERSSKGEAIRTRRESAQTLLTRKTLHPKVCAIFKLKQHIFCILHPQIVILPRPYKQPTVIWGRFYKGEEGCSGAAMHHSAPQTTPAFALDLELTIDIV